MAGQIARLVDSAPVGDTRMQNHAERFADRLVLPTLGLAVSTAAVTRDFNRFLSLVIIDYGTGIRVAAPTAVLSSMTNAARNGVLIKSGSHMEKLAEVDTIVFDKTGTLSHGTPHVKLAGLVAYEDRIRPESRQVIETLYGMGIRDTIMLTGDNTAVADAIGQRLGLTRQIANMLPSDKAEVIQQLQRDGRLVAVVGDGINDSPALSFADVGVAINTAPISPMNRLASC
jgi:cation transport ATPase